MVTASVQRADGVRVLLLGLSAENIERLQDGQPIRITRESHGIVIPADVKIYIVAGETESDIVAYLHEHGMVNETTILNQRRLG